MTISVFGVDIPLYGLMFFIGIAVAATVAFFFMIKRRNIPAFDFACAAVYALIGAIVGAKLLFILVSLKDIIMYMREGLLTFEQVLKGGFVFYGGLIGGILGFKIYGWQFKIKMADYFDVGATVLPLGHAFGRVGCFFGGCCYGVEHDGWLSHVYQEGSVAAGAGTPIGVPLLPVQLIEAACLLVLFAGLMVLFFMDKKKTPWLQTLAYACSYAVVRFILEFFRGDKVRGGFLGISTSQWISILLIIGSALLIVYLTIWQKKKAAKTCENTVCECVETPVETESVETVDEAEKTDTE